MFKAMIYLKKYLSIENKYSKSGFAAPKIFQICSPGGETIHYKYRGCIFGGEVYLKGVFLWRGTQ